MEENDDLSHVPEAVLLVGAAALLLPLAESGGGKTGLKPRAAKTLSDSRAHPNRISAGTFHPDEQGRSHVRFAAAVEQAKYPVLSVTAEPGDGDPSATGPEVLRSRT